jgi:AraC-like DNA-binding protein
VAEVAYATGFNTPSYFIKCFKEAYGKTPLDYINK